MIQLNKKPLTAVEFVAPLAKIEPIYKEEEEAFKVVCHFFFALRIIVTSIGVLMWLYDLLTILCVQQIFTCSKSAIQILEKVVDRFKVNDKDMTLFWCIYC